LGLSQIELAARAGMTQPAVSRLEAGGVVLTIPLLDRTSMALEALVSHKRSLCISGGEMSTGCC
jgi:predicted transcriptional regulator